MELIYIWAENYKNIKEEGFNLSPSFSCKYENDQLTIKKEKHYSLFPENINISTLIGGNGSGKTSILEIIQLLCLNHVEKSKENKDIWGVFYDKEISNLSLGE